MQKHNCWTKQSQLCNCQNPEGNDKIAYAGSEVYESAMFKGPNLEGNTKKDHIMAMGI